MNNKTTVLIIGILLILGLSGELLNYFNISTFDFLTKIAIGIGRLGGIILILQNGTLTKTRPFFQFILFLLGITILGGLFKILHWPYNNAILLSGLFGVPTVYAIRFFKKLNKKRLDILKFLWLTTLYIAAIFKIEHWPFGNELLTIEGILFVLLFMDFSIQYFQLNEDKIKPDGNTA
jgi:hypothetical protein